MSEEADGNVVDGVDMTCFGKTCLNARILFSYLFIKVYRYHLLFIWCIIRRYTSSGFDDVAT